ncbi:hypothetical protein SASPL_105996 [Salvia splendens]|uniref:Uncharacterized protein n=1 Tax=Salvia splendens TaxID=180675 RepID=A0A8X9ABA7_SALSN|nr:hypothetical protein SASPL_105996 [Salvia splendens]
MTKIRKDIINFHGEMVLLTNYNNINYIDPEEVRQENRRSSAATVHPESAATAVLHDGLDLEACEGVREHHRVGVPAVGVGGGDGVQRANGENQERHRQFSRRNGSVNELQQHQLHRAGEDPEEVRQENRRSYAATVHPESAAAAVLHDGLDLEICEGVREHHRVGVPADNIETLLAVVAAQQGFGDDDEVGNSATSEASRAVSAPGQAIDGGSGGEGQQMGRQPCEAGRRRVSPERRCKLLRHLFRERRRESVFVCEREWCVYVKI